MSDGEAVSQTGTGFYSVRDTVVTQHTRAQSGVEGEPAAAMPAAPRRVKSSAETMYRRAVVAGGAVSEFGQAVSTFNSKVRGWNSQINAAADREEAQEVYERLRSGFTSAESALSDAAGDARYRIENWDDDSVVRSLWAGGALPLSAMTMFGQLGLQTSGLTDLPPDLAGLSDGELAQRLQNNPELVENPEVMEAVRERIGDYDPDQAGSDAQAIADGGPGALDGAGRAALVNVYGAYAQENGKTLPPNAASYLREFVAAAFPGDGDDSTGTLPVATAMQERLDESGAGWAEGLVANSLLLASNAKLDPAYHRGPANPAPLTLGRGAVPQAVWDALEDTPGPSGSGPGATRTNWATGEGFSQLASLLADSDADIEAGTAFSQELTTTTADVAQSIIAAGDGHSPGGGFMAKNGFAVDGEDVDNLAHVFSGDMETMLDVATRNEEANALFLGGATNSADTGRDLVGLYNFDWADDGESVGGYTDWINEAMGPEASQEERDLARRASGDVIEFTTMTSHPDDSGLNPFRELMTNAGHDETEGQASFGEYNPALVHSLVDVGSRNLDALSLHPGGAGEEVEFVPRDGDQDSTIAVSNADRGKFFTLLATDEDAYTELSRNVGAHQQTNLNHAINNDGDTAEAGAYNSRLDGYLQAGYVNAAMTSNQADYDEAMEGYQETRRALEMGQNLVTGAVTASHPAGFAAAAPTNALLDEIIDSSLDKPELETYDTSGLENTEYSEARAGYAYLAASHQADPDSLTERDREILLDENGDLRSFQEVDPRHQQQFTTERDHTSDDVPAAERGRNEYVMNNQTANTFAEVDGSDDIQGYLDGEAKAPTPGDGDDDDG